MKITFYGTRGSIPVCNPEFQEFGGNTTCILIQSSIDNNWAVFDAGTGIRDLGKAMIKQGYKQDKIYILFSHFHWDHIQGFPFFPQVYNPDQEINILAMGRGRKIENLKDIFEHTLQSEYFPVQLGGMGAKFNFVLPDKVRESFEGATITALRLNHPGGSYGYRIEMDDKILVICTDIEHGKNLDPKVIALAKDADLLIHEAQYTDEELENYPGWGHSSYRQALEVAELANVKQLAMTHHDPDHDDEFLRKIEKQCQERFKDCVLARDYMTINF